MSELNTFPVLEFIVKTLKNAIADIAIESIGAGEFLLKDGNDEIRLKQEDNDGKMIVKISDPRQIIYSEDLLDTFQHLDLQVKNNNALKEEIKNATIIINDLNIETEQVYLGIKDFFDQLSNSYEFYKKVDSKISKFSTLVKFGKHLFGLSVENNEDTIKIEPKFPAAFDAAIAKTVTEDTLKVEQAVNKMFKL